MSDVPVDPAYRVAGGAKSGVSIGEPVLRSTSRARTLEAIDAELKRIWAVPRPVPVSGDLGMGEALHAERSATERHVAARTSVLNLVVVANHPETAERAAATIATLSGRHPSRTLILAPADPDGPSWLDAQVQTRCVLPRAGGSEACSEFVLATIGGEAGRHLESVVAPLLIHDLPVTLWWPGSPPFGTASTASLLATADRLVVDGSSFGGSGLDRLCHLAGLLSGPLQISDFALLRQSRWREAIASVFDQPEYLPYLGAISRIAVQYAVHGRATGAENMVKPLYHAAWFVSRLGATALAPLARAGDALSGIVRVGRREIGIDLRPVESGMPVGTTLRVTIEAERRNRTLRADVTAALETVRVHVEGTPSTLDRSFRAARRTDADLLAEAIEAGGRDRVAVGTLRLAAALASGN